MTTDERVTVLHDKMDARRRRLEQRKTAVIGAAATVLGICLILFIYSVGMAQGIGQAGKYSGSMMLFENARGYVLCAIIAFTVAVILTVVCIRIKEKNDREASVEKKCSDNHQEEEVNL